MSVEYWDQRYSHPNHVYGYRPNDFLRQQALLLRPGSRVLCLADGEGRNGVWLAGQGHRVTSVDSSGVGVAKARALAAERGVGIDAHVGDIGDWVDTEAAVGPWDALVLIFAHLPLATRQRLVGALTPRMADRGMLLLEEFTPGQLTLGSGGPTDASVLLTREQVLADWPGWRLDVRLVERRIFEGMAHQGLCSVVQVLGQLG
ncbi:MAG: class I SAM-dependent methyltransferase [Propionibacteriaceae bacterium]|nr:class I SAM-dependent methyltransferase [Propionibacteriaceae bacterium]